MATPAATTPASSDRHRDQPRVAVFAGTLDRRMAHSLGSEAELCSP
jgi:hypothetical protein